jgi:hypothetical protein
MNEHENDIRKELNNEDPLTGEPGSHPLGTGVGAALGGVVAGATAGAVAGPAGVVVGAAVGAVAGGYGGKAVAEAIDPTIELDYWQANYTTRDYYDPQFGFEAYEPAYRAGLEAYDPLASFTEREAELRRHWEETNPGSKLDWEQARKAMQDSWQRVSEQRAQKSDASLKKPK